MTDKMKVFAITTMALLSLVGAGIVIGVNVQKENEVPVILMPTLETLNNQSLALHPENEGCIVTSENGLTIHLKSDAEGRVVVPKGSRFTSSCFSFN